MAYASPHGISFQNDVSSANRDVLQGAASATYTFANIQPGLYYVGLTWFSGAGSAFANNTAVTVLNGATPVLNFNVNQELGPDQPGGANYIGSAFIEGVFWQAYAPGGFINVATAATLSVTISNTAAEGLILADGVILVQVATAPPGNSEDPALDLATDWLA
jgi:hypothetical protein